MATKPTTIPPEDVAIIEDVMEDNDPYGEGWDDGYYGRIPHNPYPVGTKEHELWDDGYSQGCNDS